MTRTDARIERANREAERFGEPLPLDYDEFVQNEVMPTYIFYNGKNGTGYCTKCKTDFSYDKRKCLLRHRKDAICPVCGRKGTARAEGMSRTKDEIYWSVYLYTHEGEVFSRYFRHYTNYQNYREFTIHTTELFRSTANERLMFETRAIKAYGKWDIYSDGAFFNYMFPRWSDWNVPYNAKVYDAVTLSDEYKYVPFRELAQMANDVKPNALFQCEEVLDFYKRFPFVEQLIKSGFNGLVACLMENFGHASYIDATKTELVKMLKLDRRRYEILKTVDGACIDDLRLLQDFPNISAQDFYWLKAKGYYGYNASWLRTAMQYSSIAKIKSYVQKHALRNAANSWSKAENTLEYWEDYLGFRAELGTDLHDEYYLFPNDLKRAHDEAYAERQAKREKIEKEKRKKQNILIAEMNKDKANFAPFNLHYCGLFVRLPKDGDEIRHEGEALHHCVGSYVSRVESGETTILFIRKESEPDKPFYTMEWKDAKIRQCYGAHDIVATEEVVAFERAFEQAVEEEYKKATARKAA